MTRSVLLAALGAACTLACACAGAAHAGVVASSTAGYVAGPALASDGRLMLGVRAGRSVRVVAIDPTARRRPETLGTFSTASPAGRYWTTTVTLTGTGGVVGVHVDVRTQPGGHGEPPELVSSRGQTLLPAVGLGSCSPGGGVSPGLQVAGGATFAATIGEGCSDAIRIHGAGGVRTIPVAAATAITQVRARGDYVAWDESTGVASRTSTVVLARASTGAVLLRAAVGGYGVQGLGVGDDGTVAWISASAASGCQGTLYAVSIARPEPRSSPARARRVRSAPTRATTPTSSTSSASASSTRRPPTGRPPTAAGAHASWRGIPTGDGGTGQIAFDGRTLYGVTRDCDAERLLAVDVDEPGGTSRRCATGIPAALPGGARGVGPAAGRHAAHGDRPAALPDRLPRRAAADPAARRDGTRRRQRRRPGPWHDHGARAAGALRAGLAACGNGLRVRAAFFQQPVRTAYAPRVRQPVSVLRLRAAGPCRRRPAPPFGPPILFG
jgi:hypothetical protein